MVCFHTYPIRRSKTNLLIDDTPLANDPKDMVEEGHEHGAPPMSVKEDKDHMEPQVGLDFL